MSRIPKTGQLWAQEFRNQNSLLLLPLSQLDSLGNCTSGWLTKLLHFGCLIQSVVQQKLFYWLGLTNEITAWMRGVAVLSPGFARFFLFRIFSFNGEEL